MGNEESIPEGGRDAGAVDSSTLTTTTNRRNPPPQPPQGMDSGEIIEVDDDDDDDPTSSDTDALKQKSFPDGKTIDNAISLLDSDDDDDDDKKNTSKPAGSATKVIATAAAAPPPSMVKKEQSGDTNLASTSASVVSSRSSAPALSSARGTLDDKRESTRRAGPLSLPRTMTDASRSSSSSNNHHQESSSAVSSSSSSAAGIKTEATTSVHKSALASPMVGRIPKKPKAAGSRPSAPYPSSSLLHNNNSRNPQNHQQYPLYSPQGRDMAGHYGPGPSSRSNQKAYSASSSSKPTTTAAASRKGPPMAPSLHRKQPPPPPSNKNKNNSASSNSKTKAASTTTAKLLPPGVREGAHGSLVPVPDASVAPLGQAGGNLKLLSNNKLKASSSLILAAAGAASRQATAQKNGSTKQPPKSVLRNSNENKGSFNQGISEHGSKKKVPAWKLQQMKKRERKAKQQQEEKAQKQQARREGNTSDHTHSDDDDPMEVWDGTNATSSSSKLQRARIEKNFTSPKLNPINYVDLYDNSSDDDMTPFRVMRGPQKNKTHHRHSPRQALNPARCPTSNNSNDKKEVVEVDDSSSCSSSSSSSEEEDTGNGKGKDDNDNSSESSSLEAEREPDALSLTSSEDEDESEEDDDDDSLSGSKRTIQSEVVDLESSDEDEDEDEDAKVPEYVLNNIKKDTPSNNTGMQQAQENPIKKEGQSRKSRKTARPLQDILGTKTSLSNEDATGIRDSHGVSDDPDTEMALEEDTRRRSRTSPENDEKVSVAGEPLSASSPQGNDYGGDLDLSDDDDDEVIVPVTKAGVARSERDAVTKSQNDNTDADSDADYKPQEEVSEFYKDAIRASQAMSSRRRTQPSRFNAGPIDLEIVTPKSPLKSKRKRSSRVTDEQRASQHSSTKIRVDKKKRKRKAVKAEAASPTAANGQNSDYRNYTSMTMVDHLSHRSVSEDGLPVWKFTVHGYPDDIIYQFRIDVKKSGIENAGMGAFLTFLGAKKLKPDARKRAFEELNLFETRPHAHCKTKRELEAEHPSGHGMKVTLTGEHLHRQYNNDHPLAPLEGVDPRTGGTFKLKLAEEFDLYDERELEALMYPHYGRRVGFHGIHTKDHYEADPTISFSSEYDNCGLLNLGRYGPFLPEDRKIELHFDFKSFIFGHEPSGWSFGLEEKLLGKAQVLDITDDYTGEPHETAKSFIAMYVNEVGHSPELRKQQNTHACDEFGRNVNYFVKISDALKPGEQRELFVDYFSGYEDVRERKGYGKANLKGAVKSDDDRAAALERNIHERQRCVEKIKETECDEKKPYCGLRIDDLFYFLEWIVPIQKELTALKDSHMARSEKCPPRMNMNILVQQLVALRRLDWLSDHFADQLRVLRRYHQGTGFNFKEMLDQCETWIESLRWKGFPGFIHMLFKADKVVDKNGRDIKKAFEDEMIEEVSFTVRKRLLMPLNESMWCPLSRDLYTGVCQRLFVNMIREDFKDNLDRQRSLYDHLSSLTQDTLRKLSTCIQTGGKELHQITFTSGENEHKRISKHEYEKFQNSNIHPTFFSMHSTVPKGLLAGLLEYKLLVDDLQAIGTPLLIRSDFKVALPDHVIVSELSSETSSGLSRFAGMPRNAELIHSKALQVNESWYALWQVLYVVHSIASEYLDASVYDIKIFCNNFGFDGRKVASLIETGILKQQLHLHKKTRAARQGERRSSRASNATSRRGKGKTKQNSKKQRTKKAKAPSSSLGGKRMYDSKLFWGIVWKILSSDLGWTIERGNRVQDFYVFPPGVSRSAGFRNRVDFFDSVPTAMKFLESSPEWKENKDVKRALDIYNKSKALRDKLRKSNTLPASWKGMSDERRSQWLATEVQK